MLHLALALALAAEPVPLAAATPVAVEERAPAPRWPAALFFTGGGLTFWTGVGVLIRSGIATKPIGPVPDNTGLLLAGTVAATAGFVSMLVGIVWLLWARGAAEAGS